MIFVFGGKVEQGAVPGVEAGGGLALAAGRAGLKGASGSLLNSPRTPGGAGKESERRAATMAPDGGENGPGGWWRSQLPSRRPRKQ